MTPKTIVNRQGPFVLPNRSAKAAAYVQAAQAKYGDQYTFWAKVDEAGQVSLAQVLRVVEFVEDVCKEVALTHIRRTDPNAALGDHVVNPLDPQEVLPSAPNTAGALSNVTLTLA